MTITCSKFLRQIYSPCYQCGWESPTRILERLPVPSLLTEKILRIERTKGEFLIESRKWMNVLEGDPHLEKISIWDLPHDNESQVMLEPTLQWSDLFECFTIFSMRLRNLLTWCDRREGHSHRMNGTDYDSSALSVIGRWSEASASRWRRRLPMIHGNTLITVIQFSQDAAEIVYGFESAKYQNAISHNPAMVG